MQVFNDFLESTTIHGLSHINTTDNKLMKVFWASVVIAGFVTAGIQIRSAFLDWGNNPTVATISTLPVANLRFPREVIKLN